ncbi:MAG: Glyoxalase/bleomycin resistance protein/dioxygenase [Cyanobacteria bacterium RYN_339]|nr:Glyoxalase/bleomycin resistance protein/dioxygenase [Cyanobacteria bacterium RYN_339]
MLTNAPPIAFLATTDAERARAFYEGQLGLTFVADQHVFLLFDAHGTRLHIQKVEAVDPPGYTVLGWQVADIAGEVRALAASGVTFERYDFIEHDEAGIWTAPGGARIAWFKDPDGHTLSLTQL